MSSDSTVREVHLVLGAGGAKCISYAGALSVLEDHGIHFKTVSACSAGTLIGALLCTGMTADDILQAVHQDLSTLIGKPILPRPLQLLGLFKWPFARYKTPGYLEFFESLAGRPKFHNLKIPLSVMGVDIAANRILLYSNDTHRCMLVSEAIRIATAIPTVYPPHIYNNDHIVVDAVFVTNAPVWIPLSYDDNLPIVVIQPDTPACHDRPKNLFAYVRDCYRSGIISRDYYTQQIPRVKTIAIDTADVAYGDFNLSTRSREKLIQAGRKKALEVLAEGGDDLWSIDRPPLILEREHDPYRDAVDYAAEVITGYRRKLPKLAREQIFISYAHEDVLWLERLKNLMLEHSIGRSLMIWDDSKIQAGENWRNQIRAALASTRIAVLMVSSHFLESEYIKKMELDYLLWAVDYEDVRLIWFTLDTCEYKQIGKHNIQAAYPPDKPLSDLTAKEQRKALDKISAQIARTYNE